MLVPSELKCFTKNLCSTGPVRFYAQACFGIWFHARHW